MKRIVGVFVFAALVSGVFATPARVLTMGAHDNFFMDETSVFRNPANVSIYPNMLMGSFGEYKVETSADTSKQSGIQLTSRQPKKPYFGGIVSYSLKQSSEEGNQYPMLSVGAVFNRHDKMLDYFSNDSASLVSLYGMAATDTGKIQIVPAVGKIDGMIGYALPNGGMIGVGTYLAFQQYTADKITLKESSVYRFNLGLNWPVAKSMDLEASVGVSWLTLIGLPNEMNNPAPSIICKNDKVINADLRLFSALPSINGDVVPHVGVDYAKLAQGKITTLEVTPGIGININIDKGFFWSGIEAIYMQNDKAKISDTEPATSKMGVGGRISGGIERNVVWDWFSMRVGMNKKLVYVVEDDKNSYWSQNPETDADDDLVAWGMGINIENRLKFDAVVAEEIQNTFTNLFSGNMHHILTRIDATFSF